jgi:hypothetical protein
VNLNHHGVLRTPIGGNRRAFGIDFPINLLHILLNIALTSLHTNASIEEFLA